MAYHNIESNYLECTKLAHDTILEYNIFEYPLNVKETINKILPECKLVEYCPFDDEKISISDDGYSEYKDGEFKIFYNTFQLNGRIKFTLFHELGHVLRGHHIYYKEQTLASGGLCDGLEREGNCFSRNFNFPIWLMELLNLTPEYLKKYASTYSEILGLSQEFLFNRAKFYKWDLDNFKYCNYPKEIFKNFNINPEAINKNMHLIKTLPFELMTPLLKFIPNPFEK